MRADEPFPKVINQHYINKLRYERLIAKAREFRNKAWYYVWLNNDEKMIDKCQRIAEALEARARRIKEGM